MAVYTEVDEAALDHFLARYDIGRAISFHGIAEGVENSNYMLETERGRFILTLYEKRVARADLPFFLGLMDHLAEKGAATPRPVRGRDGEALRELAGKPAAITTFLSGREARSLTPERCRAVGAALAELHRCGEGFAMRRANALGPDAWPPLYARCEGRAGEVEAGLGALIERSLERIGGAWPADLPEGVIHADLFPDNVFFDRERVTGVIDFYFACTDLRAYDLAICLNAWCFDHAAAFDRARARALIEGYRSSQALTPAEIEALPILAAGAALRFLLTRLHDWLHHDPAALVTPHDPLPYAERLRFHENIDHPGDYGVG